jgi:DNA-binding MarR family transcriptional regulator
VSPEEAEFVDRMGLVMERLGGARTMGRLYGRLLICDPPDRSLTELATDLRVSKASVSVVARHLEAAGMVERVPAGGREHRYRITAGGWAETLKVQLVGVRLGLEALEFGLSALDPRSPLVRARLEEARDFFAFGEFDTNELVRRWEEYRDRDR